MYGDPDHLLALARSIEQRADDVRAQARTMVARGDATPRVGRAPQRHRDALRDDATAFLHCADDLDDAAAALRAHAERVRDEIGLIAAAERRVSQLLHDAGDTVERGLHALTHWPTHWPWSPSSPPAPGSRDWLTLADLVDRHVPGAA